MSQHTDFITHILNTAQYCGATKVYVVNMSKRERKLKEIRKMYKCYDRKKDERKKEYEVGKW